MDEPDRMFWLDLAMFQAAYGPYRWGGQITIPSEALIGEVTVPTTILDSFLSLSKETETESIVAGEL